MQVNTVTDLMALAKELFDRIPPPPSVRQPTGLILKLVKMPVVLTVGDLTVEGTLHQVDNSHITIKAETGILTGFPKMQVTRATTRGIVLECTGEHARTGQCPLHSIEAMR